MNTYTSVTAAMTSVAAHKLISGTCHQTHSSRHQIQCRSHVACQKAIANKLWKLLAADTKSHYSYHCHDLSLPSLLQW